MKNFNFEFEFGALFFQKLPDADSLILVSQMFSTIKVIRLDNVSCSRSEKPLVATSRGQVFVIARILGNLDAPHPVGHGSHTHGILTKSKVQIVARIRNIKVDVESSVGTANGGYGYLVGDTKLKMDKQIKIY